MKVIFESQSEKARIVSLASSAPVSARSDLYLQLLQNGLVEGETVEASVQDESLVDPDIPQIKL